MIERITFNGPFKDMNAVYRKLTPDERKHVCPRGNFIDSPHDKLRLIIYDDHTPIAFTEGTAFPDAPTTLILTIAIIPGYRGMGLAMKMLSKTAEWAALNMFDTLLARIDVDNYASIKVIERFGFERVRTSDGQHRYTYDASVTKEFPV